VTEAALPLILVAVFLMFDPTNAGAADVTQHVSGFTPGQVYREFALHNGGSRAWRVTDPAARNPGAHQFLPNPTLEISVGDLSGATRAEALIDRWSGHAGTSGKGIRFNGGPWLSVPEPTTMAPGTHAELYLYQDNPIIQVPLDHLTEGVNTVEATCTTIGDRPWGQWGLYSIILRVYYDPYAMPHATGRIELPSDGESLTDNPVVRVAVGNPQHFCRADVLAFHQAYDVDGDGLYRDWVRCFHQPARGSAANLRCHVGTTEAPPFQLTWDTRWVPDQSPGQVSLIARVQDAGGTWFVTDRVAGLSLAREGCSVRMYTASDVPDNFTVRVGREKQCRIVIPESEDLSRAEAAVLHLRTWHGDAGPHHPFRLNDWSRELEGINHHYSYNVHPVPVGVLQNGDNVFSVSSDTEHHGVEVLWPGPALMIRYRTN
jgi:hypothetical protein